MDAPPDQAANASVCVSAARPPRRTDVRQLQAIWNQFGLTPPDLPPTTGSGMAPPSPSLRLVSGSAPGRGCGPVALGALVPGAWGPGRSARCVLPARCAVVSGVARCPWSLFTHQKGGEWGPRPRTAGSLGLRRHRPTISVTEMPTWGNEWTKGASRRRRSPRLNRWASTRRPRWWPPGRSPDVPAMPQYPAASRSRAASPRAPRPRAQRHTEFSVDDAPPPAASQLSHASPIDRAGRGTRTRPRSQSSANPAAGTCANALPSRDQNPGRS